MKAKSIIIFVFLLGIFIVAACEKQAVGRKIIPSENVNCESYITKQNCLKYEQCNWDGKKCVKSTSTEITVTTLPKSNEFSIKTDYINDRNKDIDIIRGKDGNSACIKKGYTGCVTQFKRTTNEYYLSTNGKCNSLQYRDNSDIPVGCSNLIQNVDSGCAYYSAGGTEPIEGDTIELSYPVILCYK